jgi:hypothetical protein
MSLVRIFGLVLLAVGVAMLVIGHNAREAPLEQLSQSLTGRYTNETQWYLFGGIAAVVAGGALALFGLGGRR